MALATTLRPIPSAELPNPLLFVAELSHRVANEYAFMIASISAAAAHSSNAETKAALTGVSQLFFDYAEVHRALQPPLGEGPVDLCAYLQRVCGAMVRASLTRRGVKLLLLEDAIELDPARCWRVGLIVSELINNALRHAFSQDGGAIILEVRSRDGVVQCRVTDDGRPNTIAAPGQGSRIVDALAAELDGKIERNFGQWGAAVLLSFPLDPGRGARSALSRDKSAAARPVL